MKSFRKVRNPHPPPTPIGGRMGVEGDVHAGDARMRIRIHTCEGIQEITDIKLWEE